MGSELPTGWELRNNPGVWGATTPRYVIMGFSKGANQQLEIPFEEIAFHGLRARLQSVLLTLGLVKSDVDFDTLFTGREKTFAFESLVKCSLAYKGKTSGVLINKSIKKRLEPVVVCSKKFLSQRVGHARILVMLGVGSEYIINCKTLFGDIFQGIHSETDVSYAVGSTLFVHVAHPSKANGTFNNWLHDSVGNMAAKRDIAVREVSKFR